MIWQSLFFLELLLVVALIEGIELFLYMPAFAIAVDGKFQVGGFLKLPVNYVHNVYSAFLWFYFIRNGINEKGEHKELNSMKKLRTPRWLYLMRWITNFHSKFGTLNVHLFLLLFKMRKLFLLYMTGIFSDLLKRDVTMAVLKIHWEYSFCDGKIYKFCRTNHVK